MRNSSKIFLAFAGILFLTSFVSAVCNSTQIDVNTASLADLDKIKWVGPATAQLIIDYRNNKTFDSVDELINVKGIGETKIADIKQQALACVFDENSNIDDSIAQNASEEVLIKIVENNEIIANDSIEKNSDITNKEPSKITFSAINLTPKDIKGGNNSGKTEDYAIYGLVGFCILLLSLFIIKKRFSNKNEFE